MCKPSKLASRALAPSCVLLRSQAAPLAQRHIRRRLLLSTLRLERHECTEVRTASSTTLSELQIKPESPLGTEFYTYAFCTDEPLERHTTTPTPSTGPTSSQSSRRPREERRRGNKEHVVAEALSGGDHGAAVADGDGAAQPARCRVEEARAYHVLIWAACCLVGGGTSISYGDGVEDAYALVPRQRDARDDL